MHSADNDFFEAYIHLNKLCADIYSSQNGVTAYLDEMSDAAREGRHLVPSWESDYENLRHIRHIRNQMAHESAPYPLSDSEDLDFAEDFYDRIMTGRDPLALLRKAKEAKDEERNSQKNPPVSPIKDTREVSSPSVKPNVVITAIAVAVAALIVFLLLHH